MQRRRLIWQLYPSYLLITLLSLLAVTVYSTRSLRSFFLEETAANLYVRARLIEPEVRKLLEERSFASLDSLLKDLGARSKTRFTIILPDGRVVADSDHEPGEMDNHGDRPEISSAFEGNTGQSTRFSNTLLTTMMYVASPLRAEGAVRAVIRTSTPLESVNDALWGIYKRIGLAWLIIAILATWISWVNARRLSTPLEEMKLAARRMAAGDLTGRLPTTNIEEVGGLADAMNQMTRQLDDRIRTIERQRREQKAVFASISESVFAVEQDGLLLSMNRAAAKLFGVKRSKVRGKTIQEVIANSDLRFFVVQSLQKDKEIEDEIELEFKGEKRYLQAHGRPLKDEESASMGAVIVLNDVTNLRRLEQARRDFVANVSHELRTPVTSIKGFVETLMDGAIDDPEASSRFLDIIQRQASRLDAIIEDLLTLARLERDTEHRDVIFDQVNVAELIAHTSRILEPVLEEKGIRLEVACPPELEITANQALLEQALFNLVDNAMKYSESDSAVTIEVVDLGKSVQLQIIDSGAGISPEHLPRLFERFYRVDKGRSRRAGGTGLGLAIVKHIVLVHSGSVEVESTLGIGTTFTIQLPKQISQQPQLTFIKE